MEKIHDRMPIILDLITIDYWLNPDNKNIDDLQKMLRPCQKDFLQVWQVGTCVNSTRNEGPELIKPR